MRIRVGEVRRLKTKDPVLVTSVNSTYVTVVPVFNGAKNMVGRYLDYKDTQFALDFPAKVNHELVGEFIFKVPETLTPKIGRDRPSTFAHVADRMQMLSYINDEDDIRRVLKAEGNL